MYTKLKNLMAEAPAVPLSDDDRYLILSDMHLGDGSKRDDFIHNADMVHTLLEEYYLPRKYGLVLNGDIEELQRFSLKHVIIQWQELYGVFQRFMDETSLYKIVGNHDYRLFSRHYHPVNDVLYPAIKFEYKGKQMLVFHGHQASLILERLYPLSEFILRYVANPLGIKNFSVAYNSRKRYALEKRIYGFSKNNKVISIIGHTHRPLFESLSKIDSLKFNIEKLCRDYPIVNQDEKEKIRRKIGLYKNDLQNLEKEEKEMRMSSGLYNNELLVPALFNSGCTIGKRGITGLEISHGTIALVHWFDRKISDKYLAYNGYNPDRLNDSNYFRVVIKQDFLDYIFTRTELLA